MIPSADPQGFRFVLSRISWLESLLLGAHTHAGAETGAKNPARIIRAGHDALLDDALSCLSRSSFVKKKLRIATADRGIEMLHCGEPLLLNNLLCSDLGLEQRMQFAQLKRREFITLVGSTVAAWPLAARAQQQSAKIARIGYLTFGTAAAAAPRVEVLRAGLRDLGYIEGKNFVFEFRWAERVKLLHELAGELAHSNVDIIFAPSSTEVEPARQATTTI